MISKMGMVDSRCVVVGLVFHCAFVDGVVF